MSESSPRPHTVLSPLRSRSRLWAVAVAGSVGLSIGSSLIVTASHAAGLSGWQGGLWLGLQALAALLIILWRNHTAPRTPLADNLAAGSLLACAALLSAYILLRMPLLGRVDDYTLLFFTWIGAMGLFACAMNESWRWPRVETDRPVLLALCGVVAVAAIVRLWRLGEIPHVFGGDESAFAIWSKAVTGNFSNPFGFGFMSQPTLGIMLEGVVMKLAGSTETGARLGWALIGTVSVVPAYLLASKIGGRLFGLTAAGLVALYHFHIHYSRTALNNIADPFFMSLALFCLIVAIQRRSNLAWSGVGISCGVALYFYQGARLTPLVVAAVLVYAAFFQDRAFRREALRGGIIAAGAFLISAAPMLQSAIRFPQDFNARLGQISIFMPGWLEHARVSTGRSTAEILWDQFFHAALAFNWYPDLSEHYGLHVPLLDPLFGALFAFGLIYATLRALFSPRHWVLLTVVVWWWTGMLIGGAMTLSPPSSQRILTLSVPVCIFIVIALFTILDAMARFGLKPRKVPVLGAAVILFGAISLKTYFVDFSPLHRSGSYHGAVMTELARTLRRGEPVDHVYFLGAPYLYWGYPTIPFLIPQIYGEDILEPLQAPPPQSTVEPGKDALFVVLPYRDGELDLIRQAFPDGTTATLADPTGGQAFATLYRVSR